VTVNKFGDQTLRDFCQGYLAHLEGAGYGQQFRLPDNGLPSHVAEVLRGCVAQGRQAGLAVRDFDQARHDYYRTNLIRGRPLGRQYGLTNEQMNAAYEMGYRATYPDCVVS
jgi:hypothetical protein